MKDTPKTYLIYAATSPSGKHYIGMTGTSVERRWAAHVRRSRLEKTKHPFVQALNKYGPENFVLQVFATTCCQEEAKKMEIEAIFALGSHTRQFGYNISRGGDYDAETGAAAMRERLKDPAFRAGYLAKLSDGKKAADWTDYEALTAATLAWRKRNPRIAYKMGYRAVRIATAAQGRVFTAAHDNKRGSWGRLPIDSEKVEKARRSYFQRKRMTAAWAGRSPERKAEIVAKMSATMREAAKEPKRKAQLMAKLAKCRANVNRATQGPAASRGLKAWWSELKADPIRYEAYIRTRSAKAKVSNKAWWDRVKADPEASEMLERKIAKYKASMHLRYSERRAEKQVLDQREDSQ